MAAVIGLAATLLALGVAALGGAGATALEWSVYDRGVRARAPAPVSPALLVVARDPASEARFGAGSWDRAVLARLITSLSRAGAAAIGFDVPLGQPSAPGRGGASSDALLSQATALTNAVVYPISLELTRAAPLDGHLAAHRSWLPGARMPLALPAALPFAGPLPGLAQHARAVGHTLAAVDPDGVVRRVPLFVRLDDAAVPSFGLALAMAFMDVRPDQVVVARGGVVIPQPGSGLAPVRIPLDGRGRALVVPRQRSRARGLACEACVPAGERVRPRFPARGRSGDLRPERARLRLLAPRRADGLLSDADAYRAQRARGRRVAGSG